MLSSALNRSLLAAARSNGKKAIVAATRRSMSTVDIDSAQVTDKTGHVDPMQVFDAIDTNGDGVLSKDEFKVAVDKMNYVSVFIYICLLLNICITCYELQLTW